MIQGKYCIKAWFYCDDHLSDNNNTFTDCNNSVVKGFSCLLKRLVDVDYENFNMKCFLFHTTCY